MICIDKNCRISEEAAIKFAKSFYSMIFTQKKSVCKAFDIAVNELKMDKEKRINDESVKFKLLKKDKKCTCSPIKFEKHEQPPYPDILRQNENIIGRQKEAQ